MQYVPSLLPITSLSYSPTSSPLKPSVCFSESIVAHASFPLLFTPAFLIFFFYRSSQFLCSIDERNHMIIVFLFLTDFTSLSKPRRLLQRIPVLLLWGEEGESHRFCCLLGPCSESSCLCHGSVYSHPELRAQSWAY